MKIGERLARTARRTARRPAFGPSSVRSCRRTRPGAYGSSRSAAMRPARRRRTPSGPARVLLEPVHARARLAHDDLLSAPGLERVAGLALLARLRQDQVDDVVRAAIEQPAAQIPVDDVVRRRHDVGQLHAVGRVVQGVERPYLHALWYLPGHPGRVARIPGAAAGGTGTRAC